ncbi:MAG: hypothetical protein K6G08_06640 [Prevotella sp.]|nr:hypothetical protein [Prevotella sp.]
MRVLHIHPKDDAQLSHYVRLLCEAVHDDVECLSTDNPKSLGQLLQDFRPDIVHIHGEVEAHLPEDTRVVLTPHGQKAHGKAYAYIARSPIEKEALTADHQRVIIIRNPIITRTTTVQEMGAMTLAVYRRVMDSHVLPLMDDDTLTAMRLLLKTGITGDMRWIGDAIIPQADWHKLSIYAYYEGISDVLRRGITLAGIPHEMVDASSIPVFLPNGYERPVPMPTETLTTLITEADKSPINMLRLTEIHQALMRPNLDEETLLKRLEASKLLSFFGSLICLLKEQTLLDEGFMPCPPIDNKRTQQLRTTLRNHLKI